MKEHQAWFVQTLDRLGDRTALRSEDSGHASNELHQTALMVAGWDVEEARAAFSELQPRPTTTPERVGSFCPCDFYKLNPKLHDDLLTFEPRGAEGVAWLIEYLEISAFTVPDDQELGWVDWPDFVREHNWSNPLAVSQITAFVHLAIERMKEQQPTPVPLAGEVVRTRQIEVVDEKGRARMTLGDMGDGAFGLTIAGRLAGTKLWLTADDVSADLGMSYDGNTALDIGVSEEARPGVNIMMADAHTNSMLEWHVTPDGETSGPGTDISVSEHQRQLDLQALQRASEGTALSMIRTLAEAAGAPGEERPAQRGVDLNPDWMDLAAFGISDDLVRDIAFATASARRLVPQVEEVVNRAHALNAQVEDALGQAARAKGQEELHLDVWTAVYDATGGQELRTTLSAIASLVDDLIGGISPDVTVMREQHPELFSGAA